MSIRVKLILIYVILVIFSAAFIAFAGMGMIASFFAGITDTILEDIEVDEAIEIVIDLIAELNVAEKSEEGALLDPSFIKDVDKRLQKFDGHLFVFHENQWINVAGQEFTEPFFNQLEAHNINVAKPHQPPNRGIEYHNKTYYSFAHEFNVQDKSVTYYFVIDGSDLDEVWGSLGNFIIKFMLVILLIVILPLAYVLSKDIINPLKVLETGANKIREGDLDFKLEAKSNNEIGKVIQSFNKMRVELRKSLEKQLQYEENRKELIASISHDLKTPITSIKGYVEGIKDGVANDEEKLNKYLEVIYNKSLYMDRLIDDLFMFSKLDLDHLSFDMEEVNVTDYMNSCLNELMLEYKQHGIEIDYKKQIANHETVWMDQQKITRVIMNIVQNAVKFMDKEEQRVTIGVEAQAEGISFYIRDNGSGIPQNQLSYIFERFYRADGARNTKNGGSGLGLAIAKQIIEKHGGTIAAESELGVGTIVYFVLKKGKVAKTHEEDSINN